MVRELMKWAERGLSQRLAAPRAAARDATAPVVSPRRPLPARGPATAAPAAAADAPTLAATATRMAPPPPPEPRPWSLEEQLWLEQALATYPATMPAVERWRAIGRSVPGRDLSECVSRYRHIQRLVAEADRAMAPPAPADRVAAGAAQAAEAARPTEATTAEAPTGAAEAVAATRISSSDASSEGGEDDMESMDGCDDGTEESGGAASDAAPAAAAASDEDGMPHDASSIASQHRGTLLEAVDLQLRNVGVARVHQLRCLVRCIRCRFEVDADASTRRAFAMECVRCHTMLEAALRPRACRIEPFSCPAPLLAHAQTMQRCCTR